MAEELGYSPYSGSLQWRIRTYWHLHSHQYPAGATQDRGRGGRVSHWKDITTTEARADSDSGEFLLMYYVYMYLTGYILRPSMQLIYIATIIAICGNVGSVRVLLQDCVGIP